MNDDDYRHALAGGKDLAGCVLNGADFKGLELNGRDFSQARLKSANFSNAQLEGANFSDASVTSVNFENANLKRARFNGALAGVNFSGANLSNAKIQGSVALTNFNGANLSGADFSGVHFQENCLFDNAHFSQATNFDGAHVLRPYSGLPLFRDYIFERGVLRRASKESTDKGLSEKFRLDAVDALSEGIRQVSIFSGILENDASLAAIGHNCPPEAFRLSNVEVQNALVDFSAARESLQTREDDPGKLRNAMNLAEKLAFRAASWSGAKLDLMISEFSKEFGKTLGSKTALVVGLLSFSGVLERIVQTITQFLSGLH